MRFTALSITVLLPFILITTTRAQITTLHIDLHQPGKPVSKYLTGSCIEDVNHEIYGGIYSQMLYGESFQEPPAVSQDMTYAVMFDLGKRGIQIARQTGREAR